MARPWLFLDLDGVVSPLPPREGEQRFAIPARQVTWPGALYEMHVDERLPAWAAQLDGVYDVIWATSWQTEVLACVAEPLGLPAWPVLAIPLVSGRGRIRHKATAVAAHLRSDPRAYAWADDHLFRRSPPPPVRDLELAHLLIRPRPPTGLTQGHIDQLLGFAHDPGQR